MMLVLSAFGLALMAFALYLRSAIVSLNKDLRAILDAQAAFRGRLSDIADEHAAIKARIDALYTAHQGDAT